MNLQSKLKALKEFQEEIRYLENAVTQINKDIGEDMNDRLKDKTLTDIKNKCKATTPFFLKKELVDIWNKNLTKLISKREIITIDNKEYAISYQGIGIRNGSTSVWNDKKRWYDRKAKFSYLPNMYKRDKFDVYLEILQHSTLIKNRIHKKDKKEIIKICGKYARQLQEYINTTNDDRITFSHSLKESITVNEIKRDYSYVMYGYNYKVRDFSFNKIDAKSLSSGIRLYLSGDNDVYIDINPHMSDNESFLLLELLKIEDIKYFILSVLDRVEEQNKRFIEIVDNLKKELTPYTILELL